MVRNSRPAQEERMRLLVVLVKSLHIGYICTALPYEYVSEYTNQFLLRTVKSTSMVMISNLMYCLKDVIEHFVKEIIIF